MKGQLYSIVLLFILDMIHAQELYRGGRTFPSLNWGFRPYRRVSRPAVKPIRLYPLDPSQVLHHHGPLLRLRPLPLRRLPSNSNIHPVPPQNIYSHPENEHMTTPAFIEPEYNALHHNVLQHIQGIGRLPLENIENDLQSHFMRSPQFHPISDSNNDHIRDEMPIKSNAGNNERDESDSDSSESLEATTSSNVLTIPPQPDMMGYPMMKPEVTSSPSDGEDVHTEPDIIGYSMTEHADVDEEMIVEENNEFSTNRPIISTATTTLEINGITDATITNDVDEEDALTTETTASMQPMSVVFETSTKDSTTSTTENVYTYVSQQSNSQFDRDSVTSPSYTTDIKKFQSTNKLTEQNNTKANVDIKNAAEIIETYRFGEPFSLKADNSFNKSNNLSQILNKQYGSVTGINDGEIPRVQLKAKDTSNNFGVAIVKFSPADELNKDNSEINKQNINKTDFSVHINEDKNEIKLHNVDMLNLKENSRDNIFTDEIAEYSSSAIPIQSNAGNNEKDEWDSDLDSMESLNHHVSVIPDETIPGIFMASHEPEPSNEPYNNNEDDKYMMGNPHSFRDEYLEKLRFTNLGSLLHSDEGYYQPPGEQTLYVKYPGNPIVNAYVTPDRSSPEEYHFVNDFRTGQASDNLGVMVLPQNLQAGVPGYRFRYRVADAASGNDYGRFEQRLGDLTVGRYNVLLPDGRNQVVRFYDHGYGFQANVAYE